MMRNGAVVDVMCRPDGAVNASGEGGDESQVAFPSVPGRLKALRGRELELAQQIRGNIQWEFLCKQPDIEPTMWLCQQGYNRVLNVEIAIPDELEIEFRVLCSERK